MMGRPDARLTVSSFEVVSALAEALGAECHYIPSLLYCPDESSCAALLS
jgi:DNA-binding transcriptional regulator LsrR (DeoR family)